MQIESFWADIVGDLNKHRRWCLAFENDSRVEPKCSITKGAKSRRVALGGRMKLLQAIQRKTPQQFCRQQSSRSKPMPSFSRLAVTSKRPVRRGWAITSAIEQVWI